MTRGVVLLSGGLDSATLLALAARDGYECYALTVDYGQRHAAELAAAEVIARRFAVADHRLVGCDLGRIGGSALTDNSIAVPHQPQDGIPVTYVPARNTTLLSIALGWSETIGANEIFIGVNAIDYSGYPDCRPEYIAAFERLARLATKAGVEGTEFTIHAPLIAMNKAEIIRQGMELGVPYELTVSCYEASTEGWACGSCDACRLRAAGFEAAGVTDPTHYLGRISHHGPSRGR
jgi:7-cyano-7-deazaguanine synthase